MERTKGGTEAGSREERQGNGRISRSHDAMFIRGAGVNRDKIREKTYKHTRTISRYDKQRQRSREDEKVG
jgi:hypothetical protein